MRVLFVDDEANVLEALERSFFDCDEDWEIETATGGDDALQTMAEEPFDVVVTDMQMPGLNGTALLERVQALHPATVRIVLSGHARQDETIRVLPFAHRYLSKPCSVHEIATVIRDTAGLRRLLRDEPLLHLVGTIRTFPSAPRLYQDLCRELNRPSSATSNLVAVIERDPALAARVLHVARSTFFRRGAPPHTLQDAVARVGTEVLRVLVVAADVFATGSYASVGRVTQERLQSEAAAVAALARDLADDAAQADTLFIAGLLADVGLLILLAHAPERLRELPAEGLGVVASERSRWGATHADIGGYLLGLWGLASDVVELVASHEEPARAPDRLRRTAEVLHVATRIVAGEAPDASVSPARVEALLARARSTEASP